MKTLSVTAGRAKLGYWLRQALRGQDIGVVLDGAVIAFRPVEVLSGDYALREYGLTESEAAKAGRAIHRQLNAALKRGELKPFTGSPRDLD